jgi:amino acid transporter
MVDSDRPQNENIEIDTESLPRRNGNNQHSIHADLTTLEVHRGKHQGDKYVRVIRSSALRRVAPGVMRATEQGSRPSGKIGRLYTRVKEVLVGKPLPMAAEKHERLNKIRALGVFSSDAISSSAYATEEILMALIVAGVVGMTYSVPISLGIATLLAIVSFSYRQTVHAYPHGGGSYTVSRENLGTQIGLVAAAALLIDYVMTVAVSVSAGTAAITSAFQSLFPYRVEISIALVAFIVLINLRGARDSGTFFAVPTYMFIFSLAGVILLGLFRILIGDLPQRVPYFETAVFEPMTLLLALRAFASGSVAMSGTEAIANGIPAFKSPETRNAATTLTVMAGILGFFFVGVTFLSYHFGIVPMETETVISQVGRTVLGSGVLYGILQISTMLILVLGANTSFAGFPRLAYVLAQDGFMPHQLKFRGDRLGFTNGIIILGAVAAALIVVFGGSTHALIPLYAVGVFLSFTCSQAGMVRHWWKAREPGWRKSMLINGIGAILTAIILVVVWAVKFQHGAWIVFMMIPLLVLLFNGIHRHYQRVVEQLGLAPAEDQTIAPLHQSVIVPIGDLNKASLRALNFARLIAKDPVALRLFNEPHEVEEFRREWSHWGNSTPLVLLESPYRSFNEPLLAYIDELHRQDPDAFITIVLPEFIPAHWWENFLHNQTALRLKAALFFRKNTIVVDVPYHLEK